MATGHGYQRILVPFDGTDAAERSLHEALVLAVPLGAQLRLLTVLDTYAPRRRQMQLALQAACVRTTALGVSTDTRLFDGVDGSLSDFIARATTEWQADVVVMATQVRNGFPNLVMGNDAEATVRACPVPVLMVPPPAPQDPP